MPSNGTARIIDCSCGSDSFYAMQTGGNAIELRCTACGRLQRPLGENWQQVLRQARQDSGGAATVRFYVEDVAEACGVGKRRAQQLMDEWANERSDVDISPYEPGHAANGYEPKKKAIEIDLNRALGQTRGGGRDA